MIFPSPSGSAAATAASKDCGLGSGAPKLIAISLILGPKVALGIVFDFGSFILLKVLLTHSIPDCGLLNKFWMNSICCFVILHFGG